MRLPLLPLLVFLGASIASHAAHAEEPRRPNVVVILADDLGWADLGCYGNTFHLTPRIDALARQGMRFTQAYSAGTVCSPTRASLMTGRNPAAIGITDFIPGHPRPFERLSPPEILHELPLAEITFGESLRAAGYATGYFGKWHLGGEGFLPTDQGFDTGLVSGGGHFGSRITGSRSLKLPADTWLGDWLTAEALRFMETHRERPFLVMLSHYAVHIPLQPKPETAARFAERAKTVAGKSDPKYAALLADLDSATGALLDGLERLGLAENTLVVFASDNGGLIRPGRSLQGRPITVNDPLRGEKGTVYEGGIRVPLLVRWPGHVSAGSECTTPVTSEDLFPTFAAAAKAETPAAVTGLDLTPLLREQGGFEREALYWHYPHYHHMEPAGAIRRGDWKLVEHFEDGRLELFNLAKDLGETNDLSAQESQRTAEMRAALAAWREKISARMPSKNPKFDPNRAGEFGQR